MNRCPCRSDHSKHDLTFAQCCEKLHQGNATVSAEQLMRSRYSAYVMGNIDYIVQTTVPAQQPFLDKAGITAWSRQNQWLGLEVIQHLPHRDKRHAQVKFKAHFRDQQDKQVHHELSAFVKIGQYWYFLDPTVHNNQSLKSACLCGSQQKFKHCCAPFLGRV